MIDKQSIIPPKLNSGDKVGIISPSAAVTSDVREQFNRGIATLKEYG